MLFDHLLQFGAGRSKMYLMSFVDREAEHFHLFLELLLGVGLEHRDDNPDAMLA